MRRTSLQTPDKQQFQTDCYFFPLNWVAKCLNWVAECLSWVAKSIKHVSSVVAFTSGVSAIIIALSPLLVYKALLSIYPPLKEEYRTCAISNKSSACIKLLDLVKDTAPENEKFIEHFENVARRLMDNGENELTSESKFFQ